MNCESETLESRMMRKYQVRFGGRLMEKGPQGTLASFLPNYSPSENSVLCRLTVRLPDGSCLTKSDAGGYAGMADSGDDDKSGYSDSFKRAAVKFGVARYLYRDGVPAFVQERIPAPAVETPASPAAEPALAVQITAPAPSTQTAPTPTTRNGSSNGNSPRTGKALFAWTKDQEQRYEVGLLKYLNQWAKLQDFPGRMIDWDAEQVSLAYQEACRKLQPLQTLGSDALEEALSN